MPKDTNKIRIFKVGKTSVSLSRHIKKSGPKTKEVKRGIHISRPDGSSYTRTKTKTKGLKGVFGDKKTVIERRAGGDSYDYTTYTRRRKEGILPKVKKTRYDGLTDQTKSKTNLLWKLDSKRGRVKLKNDIRGKGERTVVPNCLEGCTRNPLNKK